MKFRDLKIGQRLGLFIGIGIIFLAIMAVNGYIQANRLQQDFGEVTETTHEMQLVQDFSLALAQVIMPVNDYFILGAAADEKANFEKLAKETEEKIKRLWLETHVLSHPDKEKILHTIQNNYIALKEKSRRIFAIPREQAQASMQAGRLMEEIDALADEAIRQAQQWHEIVFREVTRAERDFSLAQTVLLRLNMFLTFFLFGYGALFGFIIIISLLEPLKKLLGTIQKISRGDLSAKAEVAAKDELGELAAAFNQMTADLQSSQGKIQAQNEELNASNEELKSANEEIKKQQEIFIGREKRILEMKKEVNALQKELGREGKYLEEQGKSPSV